MDHSKGILSNESDGNGSSEEKQSGTQPMGLPDPEVAVDETGNSEVIAPCLPETEDTSRKLPATEESSKQKKTKENAKKTTDVPKGWWRLSFRSRSRRGKSSADQGQTVHVPNTSKQTEKKKKLGFLQRLFRRSNKSKKSSIDAPDSKQTPVVQSTATAQAVKEDSGHEKVEIVSVETVDEEANNEDSSDTILPPADSECLSGGLDHLGALHKRAVAPRHRQSPRAMRVMQKKDVNLEEDDMPTKILVSTHDFSHEKSSDLINGESQMLFLNTAAADEKENSRTLTSTTILNSSKVQSRTETNNVVVSPQKENSETVERTPQKIHLIQQSRLIQSQEESNSSKTHTEKKPETCIVSTDSMNNVEKQEKSNSLQTSIEPSIGVSTQLPKDEEATTCNLGEKMTPKMAPPVATKSMGHVSKMVAPKTVTKTGLPKPKVSVPPTNQRKTKADGLVAISVSDESTCDTSAESQTKVIQSENIVCGQPKSVQSEISKHTCTTKSIQTETVKKDSKTIQSETTYNLSKTFQADLAEVLKSKIKPENKQDLSVHSKTANSEESHSETKCSKSVQDNAAVITTSTNTSSNNDLPRSQNNSTSEVENKPKLTPKNTRKIPMISSKAGSFTSADGAQPFGGTKNQQVVSTNTSGSASDACLTQTDNAKKLFETNKEQNSGNTNERRTVEAIHLSTNAEPMADEMSGTKLAFKGSTASKALVPNKGPYKLDKSRNINESAENKFQTTTCESKIKQPLKKPTQQSDRGSKEARSNIDNIPKKPLQTLPDMRASSAATGDKISGTNQSGSKSPKGIPRMVQRKQPSAND